MQISIVADSGPSVGLGHVARCLGLAQGIKARCGVKPIFYVEDSKACLWIRERGFAPRKFLPGRSDLVIVDSYHQTMASLLRLRNGAKKLLVIDDLGHPFNRADWILNGAPEANRFAYAEKIAGHLLLGPQYQPLRREYWTKAAPRVIRSGVQNILIILGGGDSGSLLSRIVRLVLKTIPRVQCQVVLGPMSRTEFPSDTRTHVIVSPLHLRKLLEKCDLAISGAGQTLYELAFTGLPAIAVKMVPNQDHNAMAFDKSGTVLSAGSPADVEFEHRLQTHLRRLVTSKTLRSRMSEVGQRLVDGLGAQRVAQAILAGVA